MENYLAFDGINCEYKHFETIEEAQKYLEEIFLDSAEGYHPDMEGCKIFKLVETVGYDVIDSKENYKYEDEDDIPEDDNENEAWPHSSEFDEIWKHKFIPV